MKKIDRVLIRGTEYDLLDIPDKEHNLGKDNGVVSTLWVDFKMPELTDEHEYIPWIDIGTNRKSWGINIQQGNSINYKWNSSRIDGHTFVTITLNDKPVYDFYCNKLDYAFTKAQSLISELEYHPLSLTDMTDGIGRKIFFKRLPAKITSRGVGYVMIEPDCKEEDLENWWKMYRDPWSEEDYEEDHHQELKREGDIKDDILSPMIWWYRNDRKMKISKIKSEIKKS
jgi:hypothetical protein